jgi:hypothetical protein
MAIPLSEYIMKTDAKLSDCRKYRFALWRTWDESKPYAMFVGLNPSTADETEKKYIGHPPLKKSEIIKVTL